MLQTPQGPFWLRQTLASCPPWHTPAYFLCFEKAGPCQPRLPSPRPVTPPGHSPAHKETSPAQRGARAPGHPGSRFLKENNNKNSSEQNSTVLELATAQRLRQILRKGFLGKSPGFCHSLGSPVLEAFWEGWQREGSRERRLAGTEAWRSEALPWAKVASEGQAADGGTDPGRGTRA